MITPRLMPAEHPMVDARGRPSVAHRKMLQTMNDQTKAVKVQSDATDATTAAHWSYVQLLGSYVTGCTITGHDAGSNVTISISAHSRQYIGSVVAVNSGTVTAAAYSTGLWLYYDDPDHLGLAVTYAATASFADAFASFTNPGRHYVGAILTPAALAADTTGEPCRPPGYTTPA